LNKALTYFIAAVLLGLLTTLAPLVAFAGLHGDNGIFRTGLVPRSLRGLEGSETLKTGVSGLEVDILTVSFLVASIAYLLFRRRIPERERQWARFP
jgi:hypothetical protein